MLDPHRLRERAAQLVVKEARYRFPLWLRAALVGFALGLAVASIACHLTPPPTENAYLP